MTERRKVSLIPGDGIGPEVMAATVRVLEALQLSLEAVDRAAWMHLEEDAAEPRPVIVDRGQPRLSPEPLGPRE